jgi:hypothetical protein
MVRLVPGRYARLSVASGALGVALAGCSLVASLDGLAGGDAGVDSGGVADLDGTLPPVDAGPDSASPVDATAGEAGADAGAASDAPEPSDAGHADAAADADSGSGDSATRDGGKLDDAGKPDSAALGFCASQSPAPAFCDDFDEGAANPPFDQVTSLGGTVAVNAAQSFSAPDSMVSTVDANQSASSVDLAGYKSLTSKQGVAGTATLEFEIRIDAGDTSSAADAVLGAIQLYDGSALYDLQLEILYASATTYAVSLTENSPSTPHPTGATLTLGAWTHVKLTVGLPAGSGGATTATLGLGTASPFSTTVHVLSGGNPIASPIPELLVGPTFATPAAAGWTVRYDNVTFDVK